MDPLRVELCEAVRTDLDSANSDCVGAKRIVEILNLNTHIFPESPF